jgi:predicted dithiol-disulfide oxidoreductase (DUF899 family)
MGRGSGVAARSCPGVNERSRCSVCAWTGGSFGSDFNYDFPVSFRREEIARGEVYYNYAMRPLQREVIRGTSVFYTNGDMFHT